MDPVTQLLESLPLEEQGKVIVAKDSEALQALWPIINGHSKRESINDMGYNSKSCGYIVRCSLESRFQDQDAKCKWSS